MLKGVDYFSTATCKLNDASRDITIQGVWLLNSLHCHQTDFSLAQECVSDQGKSLCESMNGQCVTTQDGYYFVSAICVSLGFLALVLYIIPTARRLEGENLLPTSRFGDY